MARKPELRLIDPDSSPGRVYGRVIREAELTLFGQPLQLKLDVPDVRIRLADIIPVARDICDQVVAISAGHAESQGKTVSCTKGCSACCGVYLPAMSEPEAFRLVEDIQQLSQAHRDRILRGFLEIGQALEQSGLKEMIQARYDGHVRTDESAELVKKWWSRAHRSCPVLQSGACSMYSVRPMVCREFLAVSDPALCESADAEQVWIPVEMYVVLGKLAGELEQTGPNPKLIVFPDLLRWTAGKETRRQRTWRAPMMAEKFLAILAEMAEKATIQAPATAR